MLSKILTLIPLLFSLVGGASVMRDAQQNIITKENANEEKNGSNLPTYIRELGKIGLNFDLDVNSTENDKQNKPYINCNEYNFNTCQEADPADCVITRKCYQVSPTHHLACMAVLVYNTLDNGTPANEQQPHVMGCWSQDAKELGECISDSECVVEARRTGAIERTAKFCCCREHYCNNKFTYRNISHHHDDAVETTTTTAPAPVVQMIQGPEAWFVQVLNLALIPFLLICIAVACFVFTKTLRRKFAKKEIKQIQPTSKNSGEDPLIQRVADITLNNGTKIEFKDIQLLSEISNGRFGQVHKAVLGDRQLAVKIFPQHEEDSWVNEMSIYSHKAICGHEAIAEFIGGFQWDKKYWMLTTFYEKSSLFDFLKANTVTLPEAIKMISTMLNGLAFLHEEITSASGTETKPTIVHRDLKSKNILVKDDLSTCITDFGLALKCEARGIPIDQNHGQVGTRRYMSPEVLEGATEFSSFAFQQIDVYAAALVIWEVITRTELDHEDQVPPYELPYEKEVGSNPTTNQMRELVAGQKFRPQLREAILQNEQMAASIVRTMAEMWDHEPDGRITSSCARDRSRQWICEVSNNTASSIC